MLSALEQEKIMRLAALATRAALVCANVKRSPLSHISPKVAEKSAARAREALRDYLKDVG